MRVVCESCASAHEMDPPGWVVSSGRAFRFRCSACGHSQMVDAPPALELPPADPEGTSEPGPADSPFGPADQGPVGDRALYLKQDGKVYLVQDWVTMAQWVEESRIGPEDLVSEGGVRWEPISGRPEVAHLFEGASATPAPAPTSSPPLPASSDLPFGEGDLGGAGSSPFAAVREPPPSSAPAVDDEPAAGLLGVPTGLPALPVLGAPEALGRATAASTAPEDDAVMVVDDDPAEALLDPFAPGDDDFDDGPSLDDAELAALLPFDATEDVDPLEAPPPSAASVPGPEEREGAPAEPTAEPSHAAMDVVEAEAAAAPEADPPSEPGELEDDLFESYQGHAAVPAAPAAPAASVAPTAAPAAWEEEERRPPVLLWVALGMTAVILLGVAWWATQLADRPPVAPSEPALGAVLGPAEPEPVPAPLPAEPVRAVPVDPPPAVEPEPAVEPTEPTEAPTTEAPTTEPPPRVSPEPVAPRPSPASPRPPAAPRPGASPAALVEAGWAKVDRGDLSGAATDFRAALERREGDPEASYGYGYVLVAQGRADSARRHLCAAVAGAPGSMTAREAQAILTRNDLSCP